MSQIENNSYLIEEEASASNNISQNIQDIMNNSQDPEDILLNQLQDGFQKSLKLYKILNTPTGLNKMTQKLEFKYKEKINHSLQGIYNRQTIFQINIDLEDKNKGPNYQEIKQIFKIYQARAKELSESIYKIASIDILAAQYRVLEQFVDMERVIQNRMVVGRYMNTINIQTLQQLELNMDAFLQKKIIHNVARRKLVDYLFYFSPYLQVLNREHENEFKIVNILHGFPYFQTGDNHKYIVVIVDLIIGMFIKFLESLAILANKKYEDEQQEFLDDYITLYIIALYLQNSCYKLQNICFEYYNHLDIPNSQYKDLLLLDLKDFIDEHFLHPYMTIKQQTNIKNLFSQDLQLDEKFSINYLVDTDDYQIGNLNLDNIKLINSRKTNIASIIRAIAKNPKKDDKYFFDEAVFSQNLNLSVSGDQQTLDKYKQKMFDNVQAVSQLGGIELQSLQTSHTKTQTAIEIFHLQERHEQEVMHVQQAPISQENEYNEEINSIKQELIDLKEKLLIKTEELQRQNNAMKAQKESLKVLQAKLDNQKDQVIKQNPIKNTITTTDDQQKKIKKLVNDQARVDELNKQLKNDINDYAKKNQILIKQSKEKDRIIEILQKTENIKEIPDFNENIQQIIITISKALYDQAFYAQLIFRIRKNQEVDKDLQFSQLVYSFFNDLLQKIQEIEKKIIEQLELILNINKPQAGQQQVLPQIDQFEITFQIYNRLIFNVIRLFYYVQINFYKLFNSGIAQQNNDFIDQQYEYSALKTHSRDNPKVFNQQIQKLIYGYLVLKLLYNATKLQDIQSETQIKTLFDIKDVQAFNSIQIKTEKKITLEDFILQTHFNPYYIDQLQIDSQIVQQIENYNKFITSFKSERKQDHNTLITDFNTQFLKLCEYIQQQENDKKILIVPQNQQLELQEQQAHYQKTIDELDQLKLIYNQTKDRLNTILEEHTTIVSINHDLKKKNTLITEKFENYKIQHSQVITDLQKQQKEILETYIDKKQAQQEIQKLQQEIDNLKFKHKQDIENFNREINNILNNNSNNLDQIIQFIESYFKNINIKQDPEQRILEMIDFNDLLKEFIDKIRIDPLVDVQVQSQSQKHIVLKKRLKDVLLIMLKNYQILLEDYIKEFSKKNQTSDELTKLQKSLGEKTAKLEELKKNEDDLKKKILELTTYKIAQSQLQDLVFQFLELLLEYRKTIFQHILQLNIVVQSLDKNTIKQGIVDFFEEISVQLTSYETQLQEKIKQIIQNQDSDSIIVEVDLNTVKQLIEDIPGKIKSYLQSFTNNEQHFAAISYIQSNVSIDFEIIQKTFLSYFTKSNLQQYINQYEQLREQFNDLYQNHQDQIEKIQEDKKQYLQNQIALDKLKKELDNNKLKDAASQAKLNAALAEQLRKIYQSLQKQQMFEDLKIGDQKLQKIIETALIQLQQNQIDGKIEELQNILKDVFQQIYKKIEDLKKQQQQQQQALQQSELKDTIQQNLKKSIDELQKANDDLRNKQEQLNDMNIKYARLSNYFKDLISITTNQQINIEDQNAMRNFTVLIQRVSYKLKTFFNIEQDNNQNLFQTIFDMDLPLSNISNYTNIQEDLENFQNLSDKYDQMKIDQVQDKVKIDSLTAQIEILNKEIKDLKDSGKKELQEKKKDRQKAFDEKLQQLQNQQTEVERLSQEKQEKMIKYEQELTQLKNAQELQILEMENQKKLLNSEANQLRTKLVYLEQQITSVQSQLKQKINRETLKIKEHLAQKLELQKNLQNAQHQMQFKDLQLKHLQQQLYDLTEQQLQQKREFQHLLQQIEQSYQISNQDGLQNILKMAQEHQESLQKQYSETIQQQLSTYQQMLMSQYQQQQNTLMTEKQINEQKIQIMQNAHQAARYSDAQLFQQLTNYYQMKDNYSSYIMQLQQIQIQNHQIAIQNQQKQINELKQPVLKTEKFEKKLLNLFKGYVQNLNKDSKKEDISNQDQVKEYDKEQFNDILQPENTYLDMQNKVIQNHQENKEETVQNKINQIEEIKQQAEEIQNKIQQIVEPIIKADSQNNSQNISQQQPFITDFQQTITQQETKQKLDPNNIIELKRFCQQTVQLSEDLIVLQQIQLLNTYYTSDQEQVLNSLVFSSALGGKYDELNRLCEDINNNYKKTFEYIKKTLITTDDKFGLNSFNEGMLDQAANQLLQQTILEISNSIPQALITFANGQKTDLMTDLSQCVRNNDFLNIQTSLECFIQQLQSNVENNSQKIATAIQNLTDDKSIHAYQSFDTFQDTTQCVDSNQLQQQKHESNQEDSQNQQINLQIIEIPSQDESQKQSDAITAKTMQKTIIQQTSINLDYTVDPSTTEPSFTIAQAYDFVKEAIAQYQSSSKLDVFQADKLENSFQFFQGIHTGIAARRRRLYKRQHEDIFNEEQFQNKDETLQKLLEKTNDKFFKTEITIHIQYDKFNTAKYLESQHTFYQVQKMKLAVQHQNIAEIEQNQSSIVLYNDQNVDQSSNTALILRNFDQGVFDTYVKQRFAIAATRSKFVQKIFTFNNMIDPVQQYNETAVVGFQLSDQSLQTLASSLQQQQKNLQPSDDYPLKLLSFAENAQLEQNKIYQLRYYQRIQERVKKIIDLGSVLEFQINFQYRINKFGYIKLDKNSYIKNNIYDNVVNYKFLTNYQSNLMLTNTTNHLSNWNQTKTKLSITVDDIPQPIKTLDYRMVSVSKAEIKKNEEIINQKVPINVEEQKAEEEFKIQLEEIEQNDYQIRLKQKHTFINDILSLDNQIKLVIDQQQGVFTRFINYQHSLHILITSVKRDDLYINMIDENTDPSILVMKFYDFIELVKSQPVKLKFQIQQVLSYQFIEPFLDQGDMQNQLNILRFKPMTDIQIVDSQHYFSQESYFYFQMNDFPQIFDIKGNLDCIALKQYTKSLLQKMMYDYKSMQEFEGVISILLEEAKQFAFFFVRVITKRFYDYHRLEYKNFHQFNMFQLTRIVECQAYIILTHRLLPKEVLTSATNVLFQHFNLYGLIPSYFIGFLLLQTEDVEDIGFNINTAVEFIIELYKHDSSQTATLTLGEIYNYLSQECGLYKQRKWFEKDIITLSYDASNKLTINQQNIQNAITSDVLRQDIKIYDTLQHQYPITSADPVISKIATYYPEVYLKYYSYCYTINTSTALSNSKYVFNVEKAAFLCDRINTALYFCFIQYFQNAVPEFNKQNFIKFISKNPTTIIKEFEENLQGLLETAQTEEVWQKRDTLVKIIEYFKNSQIDKSLIDFADFIRSQQVALASKNNPFYYKYFWEQGDNEKELKVIDKNDQYAQTLIKNVDETNQKQWYLDKTQVDDILQKYTKKVLSDIMPGDIYTTHLKYNKFQAESYDIENKKNLFFIE